MRRLMLVLALALAVAPAGYAQEKKVATFFRAYDVTATSYTYPLLTGPGGDPFVGDIPVGIPVTASSTTVTATTASTFPFADVGIGDELSFRGSPGSAVLTRYVTARASADSVTVDNSLTVTARPFSYRHFATGTAVTSGAVDAATTGARSVETCVSTINATSITFSIEGKLDGAPAWSTLFTPVYTATGCDVWSIPEALGQIRVGVKLNTDGGAQSVTAILQSSR